MESILNAATQESTVCTRPLLEGGGWPGNEATYGSDKSEWMGVTNLFSHDFLVLGPILYAALFVPKWS